MQATDIITPPLRFGRINPCLYRGAYPTLRNFRFLRRLQLKSIISMTPEQPSKDILDFAAAENIEVFHFQVTFIDLLSSYFLQ